MPNIFQRLVQFSRHLKVGGRLREFNFLKLSSKSMPTFHIDVSDESGKRYEFSLCFDGKSWTICSDVMMPKWIVDASDLLQREAVSVEEHVA